MPNNFQIWLVVSEEVFEVSYITQRENKARPWRPCSFTNLIKFHNFVKGNPKNIYAWCFSIKKGSFLEKDFLSFLITHKEKIYLPIAAMLFYKSR